MSRKRTERLTALVGRFTILSCVAVASLSEPPIIARTDWVRDNRLLGLGQFCQQIEAGKHTDEPENEEELAVGTDSHALSLTCCNISLSGCTISCSSIMRSRS